MSDDNQDLQRIMREMPPQRKGKQVFRLGDVIRIRSGPFASFEGEIKGINQARGLLKVDVGFLGKTVVVVLSFAEVKKT